MTYTCLTPSLLLFLLLRLLLLLLQLCYCFFFFAVVFAALLLLLPLHWTALNFVLFFFLFSTAHNILSSLPGGLLVELWPRLEAVAHPKCAFGLPGVILCELRQACRLPGRRVLAGGLFFFLRVFVFFGVRRHAQKKRFAGRFCGVAANFFFFGVDGSR